MCFTKLSCNGCRILSWDRNCICICCDISMLKYLWLDFLNLKHIYNCWIMLNKFCIFNMWINILIYNLDYYYNYIISCIIYGDCSENKNNISWSLCDIRFDVHVMYWDIYLFIIYWIYNSRLIFFSRVKRL